MMPELSSRATWLRERMDDPNCDRATLRRTYRRFTLVNALVSGWRQSYRELIRPRLSAARSTRLLDVGSGGGDLALALEQWAARDGLRLDVTGVDPDPLAFEVATDAAAQRGSKTRFLKANAGDIGERFDVVVSNHVLHHIDDLPAFLDETLSCCAPGGMVLHSDIERSAFAYAGFSLLAAPLTPGTFIREDGLLSIRRSYTVSELMADAPPGWIVASQCPSRLLLSREVPSA